MVVLSWKDQEFRFGVEAKLKSTPKMIEAAIDQAGRGCQGQNLNPMILVPYLPQSQLEVLMMREVSGLDMCGNGVVTVPGQLLFYRTGFPNNYPHNAGIKNIYRKESSIVARVFLLRPSFQSLGGVLEEINSRGGDVTLATVSKVCSGLDNDLVIERKREKGSRNQRLRLLQPDKLLDRLDTHYTPPEVTKFLTGNWALTEELLREKLWAWSQETRERVVLTGSSSISAYAVMVREPVQAFYCSNIESALKWLWRGTTPDITIRQRATPGNSGQVRILRSTQRPCRFADPGLSGPYDRRQTGPGDGRAGETAHHGRC